MTRHIQLKHGTAAVSGKVKPETLEALDEMMAAAGKQMKQDIREHPILFSGPMVRAILEGRKTQTRRVVVRRPDIDKHYGLREIINDKALFDLVGRVRTLKCGFITIPTFGVKCSYGAAGDRLWVRETWGAIQRYDALAPRHIKTNSAIGYAATADIGTWCQTGCDGAAGKWRPSIFMPRWASRITLEITNVRVERLREITEADCVSEGVQVPATTEGCPPGKARILTQLTGPGPRGTFAPCTYLPKGDESIEAYSRAHFASGWDFLNAKRGYSWKSNPWVWVVEFQRIEPK